MGQWTVAGCSGWLVEEEVLVAVNHDTCGIKAHSIVALVMMALWVVGCGISVQLLRELREEVMEEEVKCCYCVLYRLVHATAYYITITLQYLLRVIAYLDMSLSGDVGRPLGLRQM